MVKKSPTNWRRSANHWQHQGLGKEFRAVEQQLLDDLLPHMFGYHLLLIDLFRHHFDLRASPINHRIYLNHERIRPNRMSLVQGICEDLPFAIDSIDVIVLPHVLEFVPQPSVLLEEVSRVLIPEGYAIIFGFNPWSIWGFYRLLRSRKDEYPWRGHFISMGKVARAFAKLDCQVVKKQTFFYRPPINNPLWLDKLQWLEKLPSLCCPWSGGGELLVLQKQAVNLIPLKPIWLKTNTAIPVQKGVLETTNKVI